MMPEVQETQPTEFVPNLAKLTTWNSVYSKNEKYKDNYNDNYINVHANKWECLL